MALGFCLKQNPNFADYKFVEDSPRALTKSSNSPTSILHAFSYGTSLGLIFALSFALAYVQISKYTDKDLQRATQLILSFFVQGQAQVQVAVALGLVPAQLKP